MSYTLPQVMVYQEVSQVPTAVVSNLNPYVYGANYSLRRYSEADEKALIAFGAYSPLAGNTGSYPNKIAGSVIDTSYVKVYADDAWLKYQTLANSATNPIYLTSAGIRNKLRAAPRIVDGGGYNASGTTTVVPAGYHTGTVALPEAYYFTYGSDFTLGSAAGTMNYLTTEGLTGSFVIPADATASGVKTQAVDGLVLDLTNGGAVKHCSTTLTFASAGGAYFTMTFTDVQAAFDNNLTAVDKFKLTVNGNAALEVTYALKLLTVKLGLTGVHASLTDLRAAIVAVAAVLVDYTVSAISGDGSGLCTLVTDQIATDLIAATAYAMIPHVYKTYVYENTWVFKTANGFSRTASLYKDVEIGDKIKWTVTPASTGVEVYEYSTVAGLEADYTRPTVGAATPDTGNQVTQAGVDLNAGVADIVAGTDNTDDNFSMVNSKTYSMAGTLDYPVLSLSAGILSDDYVITVTKAGIKGVAEVSVANASGTYSRTSVPVEATGGTDGAVYIGNNMYVDFVSTGAPKDFVVGNVYTVTAVSTPFTAISNEVASGTFAGSTSTTYQIEVTRGGVFTPVSAVIPGLTTSGTLVSSIAGWLGGDVDDEYVLKCTTAGTISSAVFEIKSQRSDNAYGIGFVATGAGNAITVGASGLSLYFSAATTFVVGQYWVILVRASRPKIKVTDSAGSDQETSSIVVAGSLVSVGLNGVKITFPTNTNTLGGFATGGGLVLGDIFTIAAVASLPGPVQTLVLADELPDDVTAGLEANGDANYDPDRFAADLMLVSASKAIPREDRNISGAYNWTATSSALTLKAGVRLQDSTWVDGMGTMPYIELIHGDLYVEYRSLLQDYAGAIYSISDITLVETQLGPAVADNPLSLGVYSNLENIGRGQCYFNALVTDDAAGDAGALAKAGLVKYTYALNPAGVTDPARHALLEAHIASMSTEIKKRWRIGLVGRELPTEEAILVLANNPAGRNWKATITVDSRTGLYTKVTLDQNAGTLATWAVGDQVRIQYATDAWLIETYVTDTVAELESTTTFYLSSGVAAPVPTASHIEVYHPLSVQEQADAVQAISENYANKRMYCVFPGNLGKYGTYVNAAYGAASVAGVVGSVVPQQGLTNIELNGYDDVPYAYGLFSYDQLNQIAGGGTLIIMQDTKAGTVYIRHQVSTATKDGNLNTTEMSMVKNLDSISFYFADLLAPFIGRYNATPELISVLRTQIQDGLNYLGSLTSVGLLGPQIILTNGNTKIRTLEQHPTLADRVLAIVDVELPAPLNVIEFHIVV